MVPCPITLPASRGQVHSGDVQYSRTSGSLRSRLTWPPHMPSGAGAIDEATFMASFEQVPRLELFSPRDLEDLMTGLRETLSQPATDWELRTGAVSGGRGETWETDSSTRCTALIMNRGLSVVGSVYFQ